MTSHRYEQASLMADYARAGAGVAVCGGLLLWASPLPVVGYILLILLLLFAAYGVRTWLRQQTQVEVDERGVSNRIGTFARREIAWDSLKDLRMRYFSTRRDRSDGWMQLIISGDGRTLKYDSSLSGFAGLVEQAYGAARRADLPLNPTTITNLKSMGLASDVETPL